MIVEKFIIQQSEKFEKSLSDKVKKSQPSLPIVTIAMEPGSGGTLIADSVAKRLGFRLYSKKLLVSMAHRADVKQSVLEAIDKDCPSLFEDFVNAILPNDDYVYRGSYFEQLNDTISTISKIGKAVIVGRGANFMVPHENRFSIRVVAPLEIRIQNVAFYYKVTPGVAEKRIANRETKRKAFIKRNFRKNLENLMHYDLVINTERMDLETCTEMVIGAIKGAQANRAFEKRKSYMLLTKQ